MKGPQLLLSYESHFQYSAFSPSLVLPHSARLSDSVRNPIRGDLNQQCHCPIYRYSFTEPDLITYMRQCARVELLRHLRISLMLSPACNFLCSQDWAGETSFLFNIVLISYYHSLRNENITLQLMLNRIYGFILNKKFNV